MNKTRIAPWLSDSILDTIFSTYNVDNYICRLNNDIWKGAWFVIPPELTINEVWYSDVNYSSKTELGYVSLHSRYGYDGYIKEFTGLTCQEYFDLMVLHIKYEEDRPKCPNCKSILPFLSLYAGYGNSDRDWKSKCGSLISEYSFCSPSCKMSYMRNSDKYQLKEFLNEFNKNGGAYGLMHSNPELYKDYHEKWKSTINGFADYSTGIITEYESIKFNRSYTVRSNLELYCIYWAESEPLVKDILYEPLKSDIKYRYKGKSHYYIPDFLITYTNGEILMVEIKPNSKIKDLINQVKFKAARKYCKKRGWTFTIWTEFDV